MKNLLLAVLLSMPGFCITAQNVPTLVNYQGRLANPDGSPLTTANYQLTFKVYDAPTGGNLIWGPQVFDGTASVGHGALIPVVQGYFNALLGPADVTGVALAGAFNGSSRYVEVTITNHPPIAPRQQILTTPFAFQSANTSTLAGSDWSAVFGTNDPINGKIPSSRLTNGLALNVSNLTFPATTVSVFSGSSLLMRADAFLNFFAGPLAGNLTLTSTNNTGLGYAALTALTSGYNNTAVGNTAMDAVKAGHDNAAVGYQSLSSVTSGSFNTATGSGALALMTTASDNTAVGFGAMAATTSGSRNTAMGFQALNDTTVGTDNSAFGLNALANNTIGGGNTAVGFDAMLQNTNGGDNTAVGYQALYNNGSGGYNVATGIEALYENTTGNYNVASGYSAMFSNTNGTYNTAIGLESLYENTTGDYNTAVGGGALFDVTGNSNIGLGFNAGDNVTTGSGNIEIGNAGASADNNVIRIGSSQSATYIAGIFGATAAGGLPVYISPFGQLGIFNSSARFKEDIASMDDASDVLLSLRPVTFRYHPELDPRHFSQFGLIAEEVEKVDPDLVVRDDKNQIYGVRYEAVNAMLLNEFLKEHRKVEEQHSEIQDLQKRLEALEKAVLGNKTN